MNHINLLIVDDERSARDLIKSLLKEVPWINIVAESDNVDQALREIQTFKPDVMLLDIQMPGKDGFELIEELLNRKIHVEIIFVTAFEKYAIRAIKAAAFDYLLKPVKKDELISSLDRLASRFNKQEIEQRFAYLIRQIDDQKRLKFKSRTGFSMIDPRDIIYCQADSNYTVLHLESGKKITLSTNLGKIEDQLDGFSFARISRSTMVNLNYLNKVDRKTMSCEILNEESHYLSVSRKYLNRLEEECDKQFNIRKQSNDES